jgi:energy-coupling factor transporter ATP-binding protein EcfA2
MPTQSREYGTPSDKMMDIPQRRDNPFATCWTRPSGVGYRFALGHSAEGLVEQLTRQRWVGQIVGPHGSGKSTLLRSLAPVIAATGRAISHWTVGDGFSALRNSFRPNGVVLLDGWEQLSVWRRVWLHILRRFQRCGLVVTTHSPAALPLLMELQPSVSDTLRLFNELTAHAEPLVTSDDVVASYHRCRGNVREVWFELYDVYELRRRTVVVGRA